MGILTALQEELLQIFAQTEESNLFYLTGGTALAAHYLKHRYSRDLDLFTKEEEVIGYMGDRIQNNLKAKSFQTKTIRKLKSFYEILVTKADLVCPVHLALDSPFRFEEPKESLWGVRIDTLVDIATNKLLTLFARVEPRDFVDVFFLVKEVFSLNELIEKSKQKDSGFDEYYLAIAFHQAKELPDDISKLPVEMIKPLDVKEMKGYFIKQAIALIDKAKRLQQRQW